MVSVPMTPLKTSAAAVHCPWQVQGFLSHCSCAPGWIMIPSPSDTTPASLALFPKCFPLHLNHSGRKRLWHLATDISHVRPLGGAQKPCISLTVVHWSRVTFLWRSGHLRLPDTSPNAELVAGFGGSQVRPSSGFKCCLAQHPLRGLVQVRPPPSPLNKWCQHWLL